MRAHQCFEILAGGFGYQELQFASRQDLLRISFIEYELERLFDAVWSVKDAENGVKTIESASL